MKTQFAKKTLFSLTALLVLSIIVSACAPAATLAPSVATEAPKATEASQPPAAPAEPVLKVKIGVSPVPHGDIISFIKENLAKDAGLELEIVEFTDYVLPNLALQDGTIDANFFQHQPYLDDFNEEHKTTLTAVATVHIEPLGIYSKKITALANLKDEAVVGIPNDATNGGRALNLLEAQGLLTLKEGVGFKATVNDITANPKNLKIIELEAAQLIRSLEDTDIAVINGNYALEGGLIPSKDALGLESGENNPYANVLVVKVGNEKNPAIVRLIGLLTSPEVQKFIEEKYEGSVIPAFSAR